MKQPKKLKEHNPSEYRIWYNEWVAKNVSGDVLDVGKSTYWDYGFTTIDTNGTGDINRSICDSGIKDNTYDYVLCNGVYEFVNDVQKMVDEIYRILKNGGIAIFGFVGEGYEPYKDNWKYYKENIDFSKFNIIEKKDFNNNYHFIIVKKYEEVRSNTTISSNGRTGGIIKTNDIKRQRA